MKISHAITLGVGAIALIATVSMVGCGERRYADGGYVQQAPVVAAPAAPVIVNAAPAHSGVGDMLTGGMLGYMLGRSNSGSSWGGGSNHTVINKTVINEAPKPVPSAPAPTTTAPAQQRPAPTPFNASRSSFATGLSRPSAPAPTRSVPSFSGSSFGRRR
jgi:hypothetical protein